MFIARYLPGASDLTRAQSIALAISFTSISGRQGEPSLNTTIFPVDNDDATKSFNTRSSRILSDMPHAVENRKAVMIMSESPESACSPISVLTLDFAYAVNG